MKREINPKLIFAPMSAGKTVHTIALYQKLKKESFINKKNIARRRRKSTGGKS